MNQLSTSEDVIWEGHPTWRAWPGIWIAGWVLLPLVVGAFLLLSVWTRTRTHRWKVTSRRIEVETGFFSKRVDTIELWKIRDVELRQSVLERVMGVSTIALTAHDGAFPALDLRGLPADRTIYDRLMNAVMQARQQRGVMNLNP